MADWYYSAGGTEQTGPVSAQQLIGLFQSGQLAPDTLVWREGQADWLPLRRFFEELGLQDTPAAPAAAAAEPIPALPELPPETAPEPAPASVHASVLGRQPSAPAPPSRSGRSGCVIAAIVLGVIGVLLAGVLAAIAIPAYKDFQIRSAITSAATVAMSARTEVPAYREEHDRCPENGDDGFKAAADYADPNIAAIRFGHFENARCGLEVELRGNGLDGKRLWMEYDAAAASWTCSSDVKDKWLPFNCRGG
ncbi:GYF domain-containing protein [Thermomonas sp.]|uniref:GYF domain-containing protein n=1 Tax=Thermomonas sp. TaxID=1971895 RepID=UPI002616F9FA|nr:GYF domain-containing protein [Thermomonas sp.]MCO5055478.1 GYF domain-containing protein [Thermomonas sp.]HRO62623.1 GYF domain-containing protein [Thermomonas sp.]